jgi:hypothetical protein
LALRSVWVVTCILLGLTLFAYKVNLVLAS